MLSKIEISHKTIFFIIGFLFSLWLVFQIRDILLLLFVSFILMSGLRPIVDHLERFRIPRAAAIFLIYIVLFGIFGLISTLLIPPLISESVRFGTQLSVYLPKIIPFAQLQFQDIVSQVGPLSQNVIRVTFGVFSNILTVFTVLIFTFYLLLERKHLVYILQEWFGTDTEKRLLKTILLIEMRLGGWIRGQLMLMVIIGITVFMGLSILRIPFALPLAIIAGLLEVIPNIGPVVSSVPAMVVAFAVSSNMVLVAAVAALYFIINQLENSFLVPVIMRRIVGLPPFITILSLLIGGRLAGVAGVLFAVPFVLIVQTLMQELWIGKSRK